MIQTYIEIFDACIYENLMWLFFYRRHAGTPKASEAAAPIIAEVSAVAKFALLKKNKHSIKGERRAPNEEKGTGP